MQSSMKLEFLHVVERLCLFGNNQVSLIILDVCAAQGILPTYVCGRVCVGGEAKTSLILAFAVLVSAYLSGG